MEDLLEVQASEDSSIYSVAAGEESPAALAKASPN